MKRETVDYFEGFNKLFELAVKIEKSEHVPELVRRSADIRGGLYKALVNEFIPPVERGDILDMINALHGLNLAAAELRLTCSGSPTSARREECVKQSSILLIFTAKLIRELRNFKKPSRLLEYANNIHGEYIGFIFGIDGVKYTGSDWRKSFWERELLEKTESFYRACERIACCGEQIAANNV